MRLGRWVMAAGLLLAAGSVGFLMLFIPPPASGAPAGLQGTIPGYQAGGVKVLPLPVGYAYLYIEAATMECPGLDPRILAAVGQVESAHGADNGPSSAGAVGPMQFLPSSWAEWGGGGDIMNPADAIPAAARMLCANAGYHPDDPAAIAASLSIYNAGRPDSPAGLAYAAKVLAVAGAMESLR